MQKHKILALLAVFFFITISATDIFAFEEKGKINIYLEESKNSTSFDVEFKLVKVANLRNGTYNYVEELDNLNLADLNNLNTADALKSASNEISTAVAKKNIDGIFKKTDQYGYAQFNNLENGVYLLQATDINKYDNIAPTIVAIPSFDNSTNSTNGTSSYSHSDGSDDSDSLDDLQNQQNDTNTTTYHNTNRSSDSYDTQ